MADREAYRFGGFTLEVGERRLSQADRTIPLTPKAFDLLVALVRRAGRLIGKRELLQRVWPDAFVEEGILAVHVSGLRKALADTSRQPRYIETVPRAGYRFIAAVTELGIDRRVTAGRWSIAVLPARSLTGGTEGERLIGLAITDAIIDRLGRFEPLVVRPTAAVHACAPDDGDPGGVGRALRTDAVVESSFHRLSDHVRVSARLVRSDDGAPLWRGEFDDSAATAAAGSIADAVASHLGATCADAEPPGSQPIAPQQRSPRSRPEVYELCGRGRSHLLSASMFQVPKAIEAFRAAVELDPAYAPAHAGLALSYCAQAAMRVAPPLEAYRDARASALRALSVDDRSADAQLALGTVLFVAEWDWVGAERCLLRALAINPNHVQGYVMYGRLLDALARPREALDMKLRAFERDPLSPLVHVQIALSHWNQRQYDESIEWANKALALDSRHLLAREFLASAYLQKGDISRYLAEVIEHAACADVPPETLEPLRAAYATGRRAGARYCLEQLFAHQTVPAFQLALFSAEAGDIDAAFGHLDRAIGDRDPSLVDLAVGPQWDSLRGDPRFIERLARMDLVVGRHHHQNLRSDEPVRASTSSTNDRTKGPW